MLIEDLSIEDELLYVYLKIVLQNLPGLVEIYKDHKSIKSRFVLLHKIAQCVYTCLPVWVCVNVYF